MIARKIRNCTIFHLFLIIPFTIVSSADETASLKAMPKRNIVASERFKNFIKPNIPSNIQAQLKKNGIDLKQLKECDIPSKCMIDFYNLPMDYQLEKHENGFLISTTQKITLYGPQIFPATCSYIIEAQIYAPPKAKSLETIIELGYHNDGLYYPKSFMPQKEKVKPGETKTLSLVISLTDDFGPFRPIFKINGEAIFKDITVYEVPNKKMECSIVEGTITECSAIPDPQKSDYPDCRFICHFDGNSILQGQACPQEMSLILEGFAQKKLLGTRDLRAGDKVVCLIIPFSKLPPEKQTTQQVDDLNLFSLESYYVVGIYKINEFRDLANMPSSGIQFSNASNKPYISVFDRHINPPIRDDYKKIQQDDIIRELQKIEVMLAPYTEEKMVALKAAFQQAWEAEKAKDPPGYNRVTLNGKEYVWRNIDDSFWSLPENYSLPLYKYEPISPDNLDALIALRDFLEANGCQLLVVPIPDLWEISARVINYEFRSVPDFQTARLVTQLLKNRIWAFYSSDAIIQNFNRFQWAFFYPANAHPSDTTQDVITDLVAQKLSDYHFSETLSHDLFTFDFAPHMYGNNNEFRFPSNCDIGNNIPNNKYLVRRVVYDGNVFSKKLKSQILLIGNSFIQSPISYSYPSSFQTLLSSKTNFEIETYQVAGYGPVTAIIQQLFSSPEILREKKIVIHVMGVTHFTSSNFNNIRNMDNFKKMILEKKLVRTITISSNAVDEGNKYLGLQSPNFVKIPSEGIMVLVNINMDAIKNPITVIIPSCLRSGTYAQYLINGKKIRIPETYGKFRHLHAFCELPAGTTKLKIEVVGKPGTILSIRNVQFYQ